jgi:hypothetical protein
VRGELLHRCDEEFVSFFVFAVGEVLHDARKVLERVRTRDLEEEDLANESDSIVRSGALPVNAEEQIVQSGAKVFGEDTRTLQVSSV